MGGDFYFLREIGNLGDAYRRIAARLRTEYLLGFYPDGATARTGWHTLTIGFSDAAAHQGAHLGLPAVLLRSCRKLAFLGYRVLAQRQANAVVYTYAMIRRRFRWRLASRTLILGKRTLIMGVLNVSPDSFSDGGKFLEVRAAIRHAFEMAKPARTFWMSEANPRGRDRPAFRPRKRSPASYLC